MFATPSASPASTTVGEGTQAPSPLPPVPGAWDAPRADDIYDEEFWRLSSGHTQLRPLPADSTLPADADGPDQGAPYTGTPSPFPVSQ